MAQTLQLKRETSAWWSTNNPVLALGEFGFESDTDHLKLGDGSTAWNLLDYAATREPSAAVLPGGGATISTIACATTNVGTISHPAMTAASVKTRRRRYAVTSAGTAGAFSEIRMSGLVCWQGNAAGFGGYRFSSIFALDTLQTGLRFFTGLEGTVTAATNVDPTTSTTNAKIGVACNANTGNFQFINNTAGSTPTVLDLGASFPVNTTDLYRVVCVVQSNTASLWYHVTNLTSGAVASNTITTNLPAATTYLAAKTWMTNNATAAAVAYSGAEMRITTLHTAA